MALGVASKRTTRTGLQAARVITEGREQVIIVYFHKLALRDNSKYEQQHSIRDRKGHSGAIRAGK